ncbi:hypothetical protein [Paraburkholderia sp. JHI869]|uniref:hypothetical protein n=1 Tax=Paraburkholderia sp. JHI869 TaxID=3112959 RepID=UPI00318108A3
MSVHSFEIDDAVEHGVHAAVFLYNLRFWIQHNKANGKHLFDGRTWTYNSAKALSQLFPYLSADQIKRTIKKLVDGHVVVTRALSENSWERVNWYAFVDEARMLKMPESPDAPHSAKSPNASGEIAQSIERNRPIDSAISPNHCTDVNAVEKHISVLDEVASRPDWFLEEQGAGDQLSPVDPSAATKLAIALRAAGINCASAHPMIQALTEQGVTVETAVAAAEYAKAAKEGEKVGLGYIVKVLESWAKSASTASVAGSKAPDAKTKYGAWWLSDATALAVANQVGAGNARAHESREEWHARIRAAIDNGGTPPASRAQPATPLDQLPSVDAPRTGASEASRSAMASVKDLLKARIVGATA